MYSAMAYRNTLDRKCSSLQVVVVTDCAEGELFQILEDDASLPEEQVRESVGFCIHCFSKNNLPCQNGFKKSKTKRGLSIKKS